MARAVGPLVFLSCAPEDSAHRDVLEKHLAPMVRARVLRLWHEGKVPAGEDRGEIALAKLESAAVVLLLVSADYLASSICHAEMTRALERAAAGQGRVVPILLRPCHAHREALGDLAALPTDGRPVTTWASADDAWANVAMGIQRVVEPAHHDGPEDPTPAEVSAISVVTAEGGGGRITLRSRKPLDDNEIGCLARLEDARVRKRRLEEAGAETRDVDAEILTLKRQLRERGQVRQGDELGGRYTLLQHIGRGGFATVWEAEDRREHERVVLKVLHTNLAEDPERTERFLRGARVMAELAHPGVVRIHDAHVEDGGYCCVAMELLPAGDLQKAVAEDRLPRERVIPLILRLGQTLVFVHGRGYVHRDIKPANILLDAAGAPKLTDFDLVRDLSSTYGTRTGAMGTLGFAAPEVLSRPQDAAERADVFSLAMTALFCLHGRKLPEKTFRNPEGALAMIGDEKVAAVLRKALEWEPEDRFPTMKAFCDALREAHLAEAPGAAPSLPPVHGGGAGSPGIKAGSIAPTSGRRTGRVVALSVFGIALAVGGVMGLRHARWLRSAEVEGSPLPLVCPEGMIAVPGGAFVMGSSEKVADDDEQEHEVTLSPFCVDRTEVTVAAYRDCTRRERRGARCPAEVPAAVNQCGGSQSLRWSDWCNGGAKDRDDHPINCVDWHMADTYCRWAGKRLPTEAQWEYAARGTTGRKYAWGNEPPGPAWLNACGQECRDMFQKAGTPGWDMLYPSPDVWATTSPVGAVSGDRSAFGVHDMGGNVAEWVADWYVRAYPAQTTDPVHDGKPRDDPERAQRGVSWLGNAPRNARAAYRWSEPEESRCVHVGFRCVSDGRPPPPHGAGP